MANKEGRQGRNIAFSHLVDAADWVHGLTLCPDSVFLLLSPENEFRGELLNQRWTCGEKISSCEGAASLHGTHIKVSRKPSVLHKHVLSSYGDLLPHALATG